MDDDAAMRNGETAVVPEGYATMQDVAMDDAYYATELALDSVVKIFTVASSPSGAPGSGPQTMVPGQRVKTIADSSCDLIVELIRVLFDDFKLKSTEVGRETPSVVGIINPRSEGFQKLFFGQEEIAIPVHSTIEAASAAHPTADVFINFASFRSAEASSMSALKQPTIGVVAIIAEGVPESDAKQLIAYAKANNKVVIGGVIEILTVLMELRDEREIVMKKEIRALHGEEIKLKK